MKGHPAMSKRDFDCSSSDSSPSDTEGAQAAQAAEVDDDDSNSVEPDSEEDEPSIPSTLPSRSQKIASTDSGFLHLQDDCGFGPLRNACLWFIPQ